MSDDGLFASRLKTTKRGVHLFMLSHEVHVDEHDPFWRRPSGNGNARTAGDEMRELRTDLQRLEDGWAPSTEDLIGAPRLERWQIAFVGDEKLWRLSGDPYDVARDLPSVREGEAMCSMQILAVDDDFRWARDRRGFYLLGEPSEM